MKCIKLQDQKREIPTNFMDKQYFNQIYESHSNCVSPFGWGWTYNNLFLLVYQGRDQQKSTGK